MRKFFGNGAREKAVFTAAFAFILAAGAVAGSIYLMRRHNSEDIRAFMDTYVITAREGMSRAQVFKNALKSNLIPLACMFAAGFFRPGAAISALCAARKGFLTGFASAAVLVFYGARGLLFAASLLPPAFAAIPATVMYGAASSYVSLSRNKKNFLPKYIFITVMAITIFCAAAFLEGYVTTTFMKAAAGAL